MDNLNQKNEQSVTSEKYGEKRIKYLLYLILVMGFVIGSTLIVSKMGNKNWKIDQLFKAGISSFIEPASAEEIYPLFICPCCGKVLDKNNICCPMAKERIDYIDSLIQKGEAKKEIILSYVQKYGLNSFADKTKQNEFKEELANVAPAERPIITINPSSKDLGDVSQKKGVVTTIFEFKNEGKKDLIINKLDTSCGCTSASIIYQGKESPIFAMAGHGIASPTDWQITIPVDQTAQLKVYYDPNIHKDWRGPVTREINIFSNDPIDFEKTVAIDLNQVD